MGEFEGKVVLVTGGTSGIGTAAADAFAGEGAKVVISGRREDKGREVVDSIKAAGGEASFVRTDVCVPEDVERMVARTVEIYGRLDVAVNNAGVEQNFTPLKDSTIEDYSFVMDTNVRGVWLSIKHETEAMLLSGGGSIVNVASIAGVIGMAMIPIYIASKHAVVGLTKALALEFAQQGIRINAVLPAVIDTPMIDRFASEDDEQRKYLESLHPVNRIGQPKEVADAILWLSSEKSSFVTGTSVRVDGGFTAQ